jgi:DNA mismatch endonuclease, patch repair protein
MRSIRSTNTKPEIAVRSALHRLGFRFRVHVSTMPGKPDIVLHRYRTIVWVHGCFWHGHRICRAGTRPKSNIEYWHPKIDRTIARDISARRRLGRMGWTSHIVWECEIDTREKLAARIAKIASSLNLVSTRSSPGGRGRAGCAYGKHQIEECKAQKCRIVANGGKYRAPTRGSL